MACFYGSVQIVEKLIAIYFKNKEDFKLEFDNRGNSVLDMACIRGFSDDFGQEWDNPSRKNQENKDQFGSRLNILKIKHPFNQVKKNEIFFKKF